jgi:uncharacterized membrane protein
VSTIVKDIEVAVPVKTAYDQWTQFEEFPRFMEGVKSVKQLDDATLRWTAEIGGVERSWRARITDQEPDRKVAWRATEGAQNDGQVTFEPLGADNARITLQLDVQPDGPVESTGDALGFVERRVEGDLKRFKEFIEGRGDATGGWRGEIRGGTTVGRS